MAVANPYINFYIGNPTEGRTDGDLMSLEDDGSNPLSVTVNASNGERVITKVAIRCEPGFQTDGDTVIWIRGTNYDKWSLCLTEDGTYGSTLRITDVIEAENFIFYVAGIATQGELPDIDLTSSLVAQTNIRQVLP